MIAQYLPFLLSAVTIWMTLLAGNKHPKAWAVGLVNQALWLVWIVSTSAWGLIPMNIALWVVYARNHFKWGERPSPTVVDQLAARFAAVREATVDQPDWPVEEPRAIPFGWREVIERARDSIGGGGYSENAQFERSIVARTLTAWLTSLSTCRRCARPWASWGSNRSMATCCPRWAIRS